MQNYKIKPKINMTAHLNLKISDNMIIFAGFKLYNQV